MIELAKVNVIGGQKLTPKLKADLEGMIGQLLNTASGDAIMRAKGRRFTMSARLLAGKGKIDVSVVDNPQAPPAWYEVRKKDMTLNEAHPRTSDPIDALIYDRGKLFHELFHELFTRGLDHRKALSEKSSDRNLFLDVSNMLEDGRVEWLGAKKWQGAQFYLDTLLLQLMKTSGPNEINGLVLYVRKQIWRNEGEARFWTPFIPQIKEAIRALSTRKVCDIAFEIVEALHARNPRKPEPPTTPTDGDGGPTTGEGDGEGKGKAPEGERCPDCGLPVGPDGKAMKFAMHVCPTCGGTHGDTDDGDGGSDGGLPTDDDTDDTDDGDADGDDDDGDPDGNGDGHGGKVENLDTLDPEVLEEIEKAVEEAKKRVRDEAVEDYQSILQDALTEPEPEQPFTNNSQEMLADDLSTMFRSLLVEANREKRHETREGKLNTLALPKALTNQRCFERAEAAPAPPYVALLMDTSGSIGRWSTALTDAARVILGALLKAKVEALAISFGGDSELIRHSTIPTKSLGAYGNTPTGEAMKAANQWLEEKRAQRALVIVITDGDPNSEEFVKEQKRAIEDNGGRVLGVLVKGYVPHDVGDQFHDWITVSDIAQLPTLLEPKLMDFVAG